MKKFTIKKGNHYKSKLNVRLHGDMSHVNFSVNFNTNCWYPYENDNSNDINKLYGISFGYHHIDSVRFGWKPDFNNINDIELYAYCYNGGERYWEKIGNCKAANIYEMSIIFSLNDAIFAIFSKDHTSMIVTVPFKKPDFRYGYYLYPYFGGNNVAPNDITIHLQCF